MPSGPINFYLHQTSTKIYMNKGSEKTVMRPMALTILYLNTVLFKKKVNARISAFSVLLRTAKRNESLVQPSKDLC